VNRNDVRRWASFAKRAVADRHERPFAEVLTEARVRAAVTADPVLRREQSLKDVSVHDGTVTLITNEGTWPHHGEEFSRLKRVKGISDVTSIAATTAS
jgi:hypothetical protein